jgi:hypothetical protein
VLSRSEFGEKMKMRNVVQASLKTLVVIIILGIIGLIIQILSVVSGPSLITYVKTINTAYSYLLIPIYIILYFRIGATGSKKYNLDPTESGAASAFAFLSSSLILTIINAIIGLLIASKIITIGLFRPPESVLASTYLGNIPGVSGVLFSALCGFGLALIGATVAFAIGAVGSIAAQIMKK